MTKGKEQMIWRLILPSLLLTLFSHGVLWWGKSHSYPVFHIVITGNDMATVLIKTLWWTVMEIHLR